MNCGVSMLSYATSLGWPVLPVSESRIPVTTRGVYDATTDVSQIHAWRKQYPSCNVAIAAGPPVGLVIDIDPRNGGYDSLARLELEYEPLPKTVASKTARGGEHWIFQWHQRLNEVSRRGKLQGYPGIDILGPGRYFLVAPSTTGHGKYRWINSPWDTQLAQVPDWLLELIVDVSTAQKSVDTEQHREHSVEGADEARARRWLDACPPTVCGQGECHNRTFEVARKLTIGFGLDDVTALRLLSDWTRGSRHVWSPRELQHKIKSARNARSMPKWY